MTHAEHLAEFVARASYENLSNAAVKELNIRILDVLGFAIGALREESLDFGVETGSINVTVERRRRWR